MEKAALKEERREEYSLKPFSRNGDSQSTQRGKGHGSQTSAIFADLQPENGDSCAKMADLRVGLLKLLNCAFDGLSALPAIF